MTATQAALWSEPHWTAAFPVGCRVRESYMDWPGTVVANDGERLTVEWRGHPRGDWTATYGSDHLLELVSASTPEGTR